jgi:hypothetical protein
MEAGAGALEGDDSPDQIGAVADFVRRLRTL